ncbi:DsbA family protein [Sphingomonas sp. Tas61C01]|uniref:DsbA family protein n=1 Tax=Sphingomonas sp. Tas61C01 TaxID=3458297 RepID=UPI00403EF379
MARRHMLLLLLVVVLGWGVGQIVERLRPAGTDVADRAAVQRALADVASPRVEVEAPTLTLVVFTDYLCPACRAADPAMAAAIARDGHVRTIYRDYPIFGPVAENAARVAIAADRQGIYPALHRRLMAERRPLDEAVLREAVEAVGGDWARVVRDRATHAAAIEAQLMATRKLAAAIGVAGTPGYLTGPILAVGARDEDGFAKLFAQGRAAATR